MKHRPTDAEFDDLKRARDEALEKLIDAFAAEHGMAREDVRAHWSPNNTICYCACPEGPCQHIWDGPDVEDTHFITSTCSRCGEWAMNHDLRHAP